MLDGGRELHFLRKPVSLSRNHSPLLLFFRFPEFEFLEVLRVLLCVRGPMGCLRQVGPYVWGEAQHLAYKYVLISLEWIVLSHLP
jgi:hypothetical protein